MYACLYVDLAFQIIHLYGELVNCVNDEGLPPLHLLASKPSAFRSGSRLGRIQTIIYHCMRVCVCVCMYINCSRTLNQGSYILLSL